MFHLLDLRAWRYSRARPQATFLLVAICRVAGRFAPFNRGTGGDAVASFARTNRGMRGHVEGVLCRGEHIVSFPVPLAVRSLVGAVEFEQFRRFVEVGNQGVLSGNPGKLLHVVRVTFSVQQVIAGVIGLAHPGVQVERSAFISRQAPNDRVFRDGEGSHQFVVRDDALSRSAVHRAGQCLVREIDACKVDAPSPRTVGVYITDEARGDSRAVRIRRLASAARCGGSLLGR